MCVACGVKLPPSGVTPTCRTQDAQHKPQLNLTEAERAHKVRAPDRPSPSGQGPRSGQTKLQQREARSKETGLQVSSLRSEGRRGGRRPEKPKEALVGERAAAAEEPAAEKPADNVQVSLPEARPLRTAPFDENLIKEGGKKSTKPAFPRSILEIPRTLLLRS